MRKLAIVAMVLLLASSVFAAGTTEGTAAAFKDPDAVRPEAIETYPVSGFAWNVTTDVKANEPFTIAMIVKNNTNPFMNGVLEGFAKAAEDMGFEALLLSPATADSNEEQARLVDDMIVRGVDAICIHPIDSNGIVPALERAYDAGIPVLVQGTQANTDRIFGWYGTQYYDQAVLVGEYIANHFNGEANIVYLPGPPQAQNSQDRTRGFKDVFANYPGIKIIAEQPSNFNRAESVTVMENIIQRFSEDEIDVVIGGNDEAAMGAIMALQGAGYKLGGEDGIFVTGFDCNEDASYAIQNGTLGASINPDPVSLGYLGAVFLVQYLNDGTLFPESFVPWPSMEDMSNLIVDSSNIDEYIDTMAWWKIPE